MVTPGEGQVKRPTLTSRGLRKGGHMASRGGRGGRLTGSGHFILDCAAGSSRRATRRLEGSERGPLQPTAPSKARGIDFGQLKAIALLPCPVSRRGATAVSFVSAIKAATTSLFLLCHRIGLTVRFGLRRGRLII